jgi:2-methylaconitate cis-trans-isomerase PrpF
MISSIHHAFVVHGALTVVSALVFRGLRPSDGDKLSQHDEHTAVQHPGG